VPETVHVLWGGLIVGCGNTAGTAATLTIGRVAKPDWAPPMDPRGSRVPGPFLRGGSRAIRVRIANIH
jgi:hypothetical protein